MGEFYEPTPEHLAKLSAPWVASFSGGKDSTSLVTWLEWLRRTKQIDAPHPKLVRSNTTVEEGNLVEVAEELTAAMAASGWECATVTPDVPERLYPQILGRGLPPIHPGVRRMRWCTRSTKIDPMRRWKVELPQAGQFLTGLRLGESAMRDGKLKKAGCSAGGECGIPDPGPGRYSPILHWKTCQVYDWLNGATALRGMKDIFRVTRKLIAVYGMKVEQLTFDFSDTDIVAGRFGCIGCPAIGAEMAAPKSVVRRNGAGNPLNELYDVWHEARLPKNRLVLFKLKKNGKKKAVMGPIRLEARKRLFERVMDIQRRAGVVLVTPEDEVFIRRCWDEEVYPRGSSPADEATGWPMPLFDGQVNQ